MVQIFGHITISVNLSHHNKGYCERRCYFYMKEVVLIVTMLIGTVLAYIFYIPQIVWLLRTKQSEGLSVPSMTVWGVFSIMNFMCSVTMDRVALMILNISNFLLVVIVLILALFYNYKNNYYLESEEKFQERINRIKAKDGNHMIVITALQEDRKRRLNNRSARHK